MHHMSHAGHDVVYPDQSAAGIHELCHCVGAIAGLFQDDVCDEGACLGLGEAASSCQAALGQQACLAEDCQVVDFAWGELHY
mmetsp:Transcript_24303/g.37464  ORF Transcript_24303/g.37464 Transcript_24303/m.37464 type:complete len:82 (+) Transcript_24303:2517-2762(+)